MTKFSQLFQGRTDFLGAEEGGCARLYGDPSFDQDDREDQMFWIYQGHLTGSRPPIGIYPVRTVKDALPNDGIVRKYFVCKFGAIDIDFEDLPLAKNLWLALSALGITAWVERSRSKGYHVWVFAQEWVPAVLIRSVLQVACDVVGYSPKEIFPKQTELADGSPGNYIRLPYPGALSSGVETSSGRYVLDMESPGRSRLDVEEFVGRAWENRCARVDLEQAAALAKPPKTRARLLRDVPTHADVGLLLRQLDPLSYTIWRDGPLEGSDRSSTLFKLAVRLHQAGHTPDEVFLVVRSADERWGKFWERPDCEARIWDIVQGSASG